MQYDECAYTSCSFEVSTEFCCGVHIGYRNGLLVSELLYSSWHWFMSGAKCSHFEVTVGSVSCWYFRLNGRINSCPIKVGVYLYSIYKHTLWLCPVLLRFYNFWVNFHDLVAFIFQGCFTGTGAITWLPQCQWLPRCQWRNPEGSYESCDDGFVIIGQSYDCPSTNEGIMKNM